MESSAANPQPDGGGSRFPETLLTVLGAIGTGVGVVGWVTFLGGAILWIKAEQAGLPAAETVALIPTSVLLTQGAEVAALAVAPAMLAVATLYLLDEFLRLRNRPRLAEVVAAERDLQDRLGAARTHLEAKRARLEESRRMVAKEDDPDRQQQLQLLAARDEGQATSARDRAMGLENQLEALRESRVERGRFERRARAVLIAPLLLVGPLVIVFWDGVPGLIWVVGLVLLTILGAALSSLLLVRERWIWFGVAAFVTISAVVTSGMLVRTHEDLKLEPAALMREGTGPLCGFFVAQTGDHYYLGTYKRQIALEGERGLSECTGEQGPAAGTEKRSLPARLMSVPSKEVTDAVIGPPLLREADEGDEDARSRSAAMALELCDRRVAATRGKSPAQKRKLRVGCGKPDMDALRDVSRLGQSG
jgi:hypothetical protein